MTVLQALHKPNLEMHSARQALGSKPVGAEELFRGIWLTLRKWINLAQPR